MDFADSISKFLNYFGRWRERDEMMAEVERAVGREQIAAGGEPLAAGGDQSPNLSVSQSPSALTKREYLLASQQGERLLQQGRAAEAERVFRGLWARLEVGAAYGKQEAGFDHTTTLARLGRCLEAQGQPAAAAEQYRSALALAATLEQTQNVRQQTESFMLTWPMF
ncbi:MAG: hypothetical protein IPL78_07635 [Chloroflexi bacterium]|nr:hypothetical protein [Chloroflexota bacterium]